MTLCGTSRQPPDSGTETVSRAPFRPAAAGRARCAARETPSRHVRPATCHVPCAVHCTLFAASLSGPGGSKQLAAGHLSGASRSIPQPTSRRHGLPAPLCRHCPSLSRAVSPARGPCCAKGPAPRACALRHACASHSPAGPRPTWRPIAAAPQQGGCHVLRNVPFLLSVSAAPSATPGPRDVEGACMHAC